MTKSLTDENHNAKKKMKNKTRRSAAQFFIFQRTSSAIWLKWAKLEKDVKNSDHMRL